MNIEWNKVTWYSKLVAVIVFVATFFIGFRLGMAYEVQSIITSWNDSRDVTATTTTPGTVGGGAGVHCGGFIKDAPTCAAGFHCQLKPSMPDTGGTCVADDSGSAGGGGGIVSYQSGVEGTVSLGPTCPVERTPPDPNCADKAYATTISVSYAGSSSVYTTATSDATGAFKISLPSGSYTLTAGGSAMLPRCNPISVTVASTGYVTANISCDTGIR